MELNLSEFLSFFSSFYQDKCQFLSLSSIYQQNVDKFDKSFDISNNIPSLEVLQRFFFTSYMAKQNQRNFEFKLFFKMFKECWVCIISIYELLQGKSFDTFVKFFN